MNNDNAKKVFSSNLIRIMNLKDKKQSDLINDLNLSSSTVSNWCTGLKMPRMDKIQMLADYFKILKSDLIEDKSNLQADVEPQPTISEDEKKLLNNYNKLNNLGKKKLLNEAEDLTQNIKYSNVINMPKNETNETRDYLKPVAAHNDTQNDPEQQLLIKNDLAKLRAKKNSNK